jgi:Fur family transcriptional regulator, ferric uptake regulator
VCGKAFTLSRGRNGADALRTDYWRQLDGHFASTTDLLNSQVGMPDGIQESLRQRGVRLTRQRRLLLDLIDRSGLHLDAESLFRMAKERAPKLNRVTVYRTLRLLKEGGLVDELDLAHFEGEKHYYETRMKQEHAHIICLRCGRVEEFFGEELQRMRAQVSSQFGFEIVFARTEVGGYCSHCQALRAQEQEALRVPQMT